MSDERKNKRIIEFEQFIDKLDISDLLLLNSLIKKKIDSIENFYKINEPENTYYKNSINSDLLKETLAIVFPPIDPDDISPLKNYFDTLNNTNFRIKYLLFLYSAMFSYNKRWPLNEYGDYINKMIFEVFDFEEKMLALAEKNDIEDDPEINTLNKDKN